VSSSVRATKRCVAAAAGAGMVFASFAGAASSASAATHPKPTTASSRIHPHITVPGAGVTASASSRVSIPDATLRAGTSVAAPTVTVTDPGVITSGDVVTLTLTNSPIGVTFDPAHTPTVTVSGSGAIAGPAIATATTITFTASKSNTAVNAKYAVSGIYLKGPATAVTGGVSITASYGGGTAAGATSGSVPAFHIGAITNLLPAVAGPTAPDTAALLFRAAFPAPAAGATTGGPSSVVLASDYAPQDAESAAYLATAENTGILLTDPSGLSSAVSSVLNDYPNITTVYIVGGTKVVSNSTATALAGRTGLTVTRIAGNTQYMTNQAIFNFVKSTVDGPSGNSAVALDYTQTKYNNTGGSSSPSTTTVTAGAGQTAIVASGEYASYQDGIASGPLSYKDGLPLILTQPGGLDAGAMQILISGGFKQVILLGGPLAVSNAVETQLTNSVANGGAGVAVFRVAGSDATDTAQLLASLETSGTTANGFGFSPTDSGGDANGGGVLIARGNGFQDALAAAPYAGSIGNTPILLTENATTLGAPLTGYLKAQGAAGTFSVQALGGPISVTPAVQDAAINAEVAGLPTP